jgi:glutaredoxin
MAAITTTNERSMTNDLSGSSVVLYTRSGCRLCEEARDLLVRHGLAPQEVDIDGDAALRERFDECVPVVAIDGQVRFRGIVNPRLLRRLLER